MYFDDAEGLKFFCYCCVVFIADGTMCCSRDVNKPPLRKTKTAKLRKQALRGVDHDSAAACAGSFFREQKMGQTPHRWLAAYGGVRQRTGARVRERAGRVSVSSWFVLLGACKFYFVSWRACVMPTSSRISRTDLAREGARLF